MRVDENKIAAYFKQQVRAVFERAAHDPEGFPSYFADHEPRDEEILGVLAVSTMLGGKYHLADRFPSPIEALAALSPALRAEICREFRRQLRAHLPPLTAA